MYLYCTTVNCTLPVLGHLARRLQQPEVAGVADGAHGGGCHGAAANVLMQTWQRCLTIFRRHSLENYSILGEGNR